MSGFIFHANKMQLESWNNHIKWELLIDSLTPALWQQLLNITNNWNCIAKEYLTNCELLQTHYAIKSITSLLETSIHEHIKHSWAKWYFRYHAWNKIADGFTINVIPNHDSNTQILARQSLHYADSKHCHKPKPIWILQFSTATDIHLYHCFPRNRSMGSVQSNSIQFNSIQFNSIQFNSIQFNSIQFNPNRKENQTQGCY